MTMTREEKAELLKWTADRRQCLTAKTAPQHSMDERAPSTRSLIKYVLVELDVPRTNHEAFKAAMPELVDLMFSHRRWELVYAAYPMTGPVDRFVHIWKVPSEASLLGVMLEGALTGQMLSVAGAPVRTFNGVYESVQRLITKTEHRLMTSLPYDPNHVGYQSQTVIVGQGDELLVIDHHRLRRLAHANEKWDISSEIEGARQSDPTTGQLTASALMDRKDLSDRLLQLLSRGATTATLDYGSDGRALLFNAAELKPKSVFQQVALDDASEQVVRAAFHSSDGRTNVNLILAMPWGGVYRLGPNELKEVAGIITDTGQKAATLKAVQPLIDCNVPLAAIPEERSDLIGDGCACIVINLRSFHS